MSALTSASNFLSQKLHEKGNILVFLSLCFLLKVCKNVHIVHGSCNSSTNQCTAQHTGHLVAETRIQYYQYKPGHELSTQRGVIDPSGTIFESSKMRGFRLLQDEISLCCHTGGCCSYIHFLCCSANSIGATRYPTCDSDLAVTYFVLSYLPTPHQIHPDRKFG